jgi:drug/metabolite transporter (DMT)-like permease
LPILWWKKNEIPKIKQFWRLIALTGFLQFFFNYGLLFWGEQFITSGLAAVLQAIIPVFGLFLARFFIGEEITIRKIISISLGIIGLIVIFNEQLSVNGMFALIGSLAVVIGAFGASLASVLTKVKLHGIKPEVVVFWQMLIGQIPLWLVGYFVEGSPAKFYWTWKAIICILYLAVMGSIAAFWLYYWLLSKIEVTKAMMIAFVTPLVAVFVGSFFGEKLGLQAFLGGMLILSGVGLIVVKKNTLR